jgi:hypothetical protein
MRYSWITLKSRWRKKINYSKIIIIIPAGGLHLFLDKKTKHEEGISELKAAFGHSPAFL